MTATNDSATAESPTDEQPTDERASDERASDERASAIGRAAGRGLRWSVAGTVGLKLVSFGMSLTLAYLLDPADYGSFAIALAASQFVMHINDVGLIAAVVQWRGRFDTMAPTATTLAIGFSTIVYGGFWLAAPSFAALAGNSSATPLVRLLTITIIIDGITAVRSASLMRNFQQDRLMIANSIGFIATFGVSIGLAVAHFGAYAIVYGQLAGAATTGLLVLVLAGVPIRFGLDRGITVKLMRFGIPLAASLGVEALLLNSDYVIVGRLLGPVALGFYLLAFNTSSWAITTMGTAVRYVSIPAFARLSDRPDTDEADAADPTAEQTGAADPSVGPGAGPGANAVGQTRPPSDRARRRPQPESLSRGVRQSIALLVTGVVPVIVLISVLAPELVDVLYAPKWQPAAPVLRLLMALTAVRLFASLVVDALTGIGKTRKVFWVNLAWAATLIPALYAGTSLWGIRGTATAHIVVGLAVAVPLSVAALHSAGVRLGPLPRTLLRPFLAGLVTLAVTLLVTKSLGDTPAIVRLGVAGLVGLLCYTATAVPVALLRQWHARIRRGRAPATPAPAEQT